MNYPLSGHILKFPHKNYSPRCEKHSQIWIFMECLTVRWRKRSSAADQSPFMGTHAQKDASSEKSTLDQGFVPCGTVLHFHLS